MCCVYWDENEMVFLFISQVLWFLTRGNSIHMRCTNRKFCEPKQGLSVRRRFRHSKLIIWATYLIWPYVFIALFNVLSFIRRRFASTVSCAYATWRYLCWITVLFDLSCNTALSITCSSIWKYKIILPENVCQIYRVFPKGVYNVLP